MPRIIFPTDLQQYTNGCESAAVNARNYRQLVAELTSRFPALSVELIRTYALGINGTVVPQPMLETFDEDAELVFVAWIQGG